MVVIATITSLHLFTLILMISVHGKRGFQMWEEFMQRYSQKRWP
jgi:hypothetical protein